MRAKAVTLTLNRNTIFGNQTMLLTFLLLLTLFCVRAHAELESKVQAVYESNGQSVVNITSKTSIPLNNMSIPQKGSASGFVYDAQGHIVTNAHVVMNATEIMVSFSENEMHPAKTVGSDPSTDLAVIKIDTDEDLTPLSIGDSDKIKVGQFAIAVGNPFGLRRTLTFGVISALGRVIKSPNGRFISEVVQTDTPINPGNSGGPLLDLNGDVIGVSTMMVSPSGGSAGLGFAVSSNTLKKICPVLIKKGKYPHPWLGIQTINLNKGWKKFFEQAGAKIPVKKGLLVVNIFSGSPAQKAGLQTGDRALQLKMVQIPVGGDIIVAVDEKSIETYKDLVLYLESNTDIGDTVNLTLYRDNKKMTKKVAVEERPKQLTLQQRITPQGQGTGPKPKKQSPSPEKKQGQGN